MSDQIKVIFLEGADEATFDPEKEVQRLIEEASLLECELRLPKGHLSVSQVEMYRRCPRQYYFRYIKDLIRPPSIALVEGKAVHAGLATGHIEAAKAFGQGINTDIMTDALQTAWNKEKVEIDWSDPANEEEDPEEMILRRGRRFLELYNAEVLPNLPTSVDEKGPMVERRFWVTVGQSKVPVLGYVDLVATNNLPGGSNEQEIVDHKVVGRAKSEDDVRSDMQLTVYASALSIPRVRFHSFVKNKTPTIKMVSAIRTAKDWRWTEAAVEAVAQAIHAGIFPPGASGWHCSKKFCGYWNECGK